MKSEYYEIDYNEMNAELMENLTEEEIEQMQIDAENEVNKEFELLERMHNYNNSNNNQVTFNNVNDDDQPPF